MDIADDVERTVVIALVGPQWLAGDDRSLDAVLAGQLPDLTEALSLETTQAFADFHRHPLGHTGTEVAIRPQRVAGDANLDAGVDDDRNRQGMPFARQFDPGLAIGRPHVGCIDHSQLAVLQPLARDLAHEVEGVGRDVLIGLVVRNQGAAIVRGDDLGRQEMFRREGRLARAGRADQHDEGEVGDGEVRLVRFSHRVNTAI